MTRWMLPLVGPLLLFIAMPSVAQIHKCVDAAGKARFSDQPCAAGDRSSVLGAKAPATVAPAAASAGPAAGPFGLTFALAPPIAAAPTVVKLGCHGEPAPVDNPHSGSCNPYQGDTACSASLPLACLQPGAVPVPSPAPEQWVNGRLAATRPVRGDRLASEKAASELCAAELGPGWRAAHFHDGGGWAMSAGRGNNLRPGARLWMVINDQPAGNCWKRERNRERDAR